MIKLKEHIIDYFRGLELDEVSHRYTYNGGSVDSSVSRIVNKFAKPFEREFISRAVAKKRGITQQEVLKEWDTKRDAACKIGTEVHLFGELYPFNRELEPGNGFEEAVKCFWEDMDMDHYPIVPELQMYHRDYEYAGTADMLLYDIKRDAFIIADYKTNENLFKNYKKKKFLDPFSDLLDMPYNKYQLQLCLYQLLFEQTGYKIIERHIIWLKPDGTYELYQTDDYCERLEEHLKKLNYDKWGGNRQSSVSIQ